MKKLKYRYFISFCLEINDRKFFRNMVLEFDKNISNEKDIRDLENFIIEESIEYKNLKKDQNKIIIMNYQLMEKFYVDVEENE